MLYIIFHLRLLAMFQIIFELLMYCQMDLLLENILIAFTIRFNKMSSFAFILFFCMNGTQREQCRSAQWSKMYLCATVIRKDILCISNSICKMRYETGFEWSILRKYGMLKLFLSIDFNVCRFSRCYIVLHWLLKLGRFDLLTCKSVERTLDELKCYIVEIK